MRFRIEILIRASFLRDLFLGSVFVSEGPVSLVDSEAMISWLENDFCGRLVYEVVHSLSRFVLKSQGGQTKLLLQYGTCRFDRCFIV